jgi:hypothetical protein
MWNFCTLKLVVYKVPADLSGRAVLYVGLLPLAFWICGLEYRRVHGCLS